MEFSSQLVVFVFIRVLFIVIKLKSRLSPIREQFYDKENNQAIPCQNPL